MATAGIQSLCLSKPPGVHLAGDQPFFARLREGGMRPYGFILGIAPYRPVFSLEGNPKAKELPSIRKLSTFDHA